MPGSYDPTRWGGSASYAPVRRSDSASYAPVRSATCQTSKGSGPSLPLLDTPHPGPEMPTQQ